MVHSPAFHIGEGGLSEWSFCPTVLDSQAAYPYLSQVVCLVLCPGFWIGIWNVLGSLRVVASQVTYWSMVVRSAGALFLFLGNSGLLLSVESICLTISSVISLGGTRTWGVFWQGFLLILRLRSSSWPVFVPPFWLCTGSPVLCPTADIAFCHILFCCLAYEASEGSSSSLS